MWWVDGYVVAVESVTLCFCYGFGVACCQKGIFECDTCLCKQVMPIMLFSYCTAQHCVVQ